MALLQCEMCCGELEISADKSIGVCKYCGSTFTIPKEMERKGNLFNRATYLRQNCNFDKAIGVYESILADNCEDADALWGLVLCRYGIEFVEDPKTKKRIPTCHRASRTSILLDVDYKSALKFADEEKRRVYEEQAKQIDRIQKEIIHLSDIQEKFDVFICYKESDNDGNRTQDSVLAQNIYNELGRMNIKTFFARKTLEGKVGANYEPLIYAALSSAKVMIVLGTKPEHFEATWVKNEWSRFLDFMNKDESKYIIPAYKDMSAYQLPEELAAIQAQDMSKIGFMQDLCDGVKKLVRGNNPDADDAAPSASKESLYSRAMVFLGNHEYYKAVDYFDKVLDIDPRYARAYWGSLLATYQCSNNKELILCSSDDWTDDARLKNALQFASPEEKQVYEDVVQKRVATYETLAMNAFAKRDFEKCSEWAGRLLKNQPQFGNMWWIQILATHGAKDSNTLVEKCVEKSVFIDEMEEYVNAVAYSIPEESEMYKDVAQKIRKAVSAKRCADSYSDCEAHMKKSLASLDAKKRKINENMWKNYVREHEALARARNVKAKFFSNNLFVFFFHLSYMLVGLVLISLVLVADKISDGDSWSEILTSLVMPLVIFLIIFVIIIIVKLVSYAKESKRLPQVVEVYDVAAGNVERGKSAVGEITAIEDTLKEIYKRFKSVEKREVEDVERFRAEFDEANVLDVQKEKEPDGE